MNMDKVIIMIIDGEIPQIYDFLKDNETDSEAEFRGFIRSCNEVRRYMENHREYPRILDDGTEFWEEQMKREEKRIYKVVSYDEYKKLEREAILGMPLKEITEEIYNKMLNILPPLAYTTHNGVEMFCSAEFYKSFYTSQYAHDTKSDKYYTKLVDYTDRNTWICELI